MKEPIQYHNQEELNKFLEKGVIIPEPVSYTHLRAHETG